MKILVINAGSSSLKFQLIDMDNESVIAKGLVERIGTVDPTTDLTYEWKGQKIKQKQLKKCDTHAKACWTCWWARTASTPSTTPTTARRT